MHVVADSTSTLDSTSKSNTFSSTNIVRGVMHYIESLNEYSLNDEYILYYTFQLLGSASQSHGTGQHLSNAFIQFQGVLTGIQ